MAKVEFVDKPDDEALHAIGVAEGMLALAMRDRYMEAVIHLAQICREHPQHLATLVQTWCSVYVHYSTDGATTRGAVRETRYFDVTTGQACSLTDPRLQPETAWAVECLHSAINDDDEAFARAFERLPLDEWAAYILEVLKVVALTIRSLPRGYALVSAGEGS